MTTLTVGSGQQYSTLTAAVAAAHTGDTIAVQAGTYTNDFPSQINGLTIEGVGGIASFVATVAPPNGKAILDVAGSTTLVNLELSGAAVGDGNGAGIRYEGGNLVVQNVSIHGNQDGILGAADTSGTITINQSEIYNNGSGSGTTHNIYIGDIAQFTLTNSYIHDVNAGHEIKSRAENNVIQNNVIADNSGTGSYEIDLPNGGNAAITGNTIQKSANSGNHVSIAYGEEGSLHAGNTLTVTNNTFVSDNGGGVLFNDVGNGHVTASGNTIYNFASIDNAGHVSSAGFTAVSSRPAINETSPVITTASGSVPVGSTPTPPPPPPPAPPPVGDTIAPSVAASEDHSGVSKQTSAVISGTVSDAGSGVAKVEIYDVIGGQRTDLGAATLASDGTWRFTASGLVDGSHAFSAIATDVAGNASAAVSAGAAIVVDTAAPDMTITQSISGTTTQTSDVIFGTVSDSGSGVARVEVYDTLNGTTTDLGAATITSGGWTFTASNLGVGDHYFSAAATDNAGNASRAVYAGVPETVVAAPTPTPTPITTPAIQSMVRNANGSFTFAGVAPSSTQIKLYDGAGSSTILLGATTSGSTGAWSVTSTAISTKTSNSLVALAGTNLASTGAFQISSNASETISGTFGQADVFAFLPGSGKDVVRGFETTASVGANHDVIDLVGTSYTSFGQLKPHISGSSAAVINLTGGNTVTLTGVSASSLQASDFRFG